MRSQHGALPTDSPHPIRLEVPLYADHQVLQEAAAGGRSRPPAAARKRHLLGAGGRDPQGIRAQGPCPLARLMPATHPPKLPDAADQSQIVAEVVAAVQPPEQRVLGPPSMGWGILCRKLGGYHGRGYYRAH